MHRSSLLAIYRTLFDHFGPRHWWPAQTPFEVVVGAILTQNTSWNNVELAIANLKQAVPLNPRALCWLPSDTLEELIRPSGFYRQKARSLREFSCFLQQRHAGELADLLGGPLEAVRVTLLSLSGIGPETADAILLYAGGRPSFVIDAYTRRLLFRLGLITGHLRYEDLRQRFMQALPRDAQLFNEYHALIVELCKTHCRKNAPRCQSCPLLADCPTGQTLPDKH